MRPYLKIILIDICMVKNKDGDIELCVLGIVSRLEFTTLARNIE